MSKAHRITLLIAVVIIIGAGAIMFGLTRGVNKQRGLQQAAAQLSQAVSAQFQLEYVMHLPERLRDSQRPFTEVAVTIAGDIGQGESASVVTGTLAGELTGPGNVFFFDGDLRILSDTVAFHLSEFPILLNPTQSLVNKWTYVESALLPTQNAAAIEASLVAALQGLTYQDETELADGRLAWRYTGQLSAEQEQAVADVLQLEASGNKGWDTVARLLATNETRNLAVFLDPKTRTVSGVSVDFVRPLENGSTFPVAAINLTLSDYNKAVTVDRPEQQATARPEVFAKLFGNAEAVDVKSESEEESSDQ